MMVDDELESRAGLSPARQGDRTVWYIVGSLVVLWLGYLALFGPKIDGSSLEPPHLTDPSVGLADFSWQLETLDGKLTSLSEYRGKTIVLNLWATWCGPCLIELPSLSQLASDPELDSVVVLAISNEDRDTLERFAGAEDSALTYLRSPEIPPAMFLTDAIPATFLISPSGRVVASHIGAAKWDDPSVIAFLKAL